MPLTINYHTLKETEFDYPFRIFVSGSSQSGKTYFARELLAHSKIFGKQIETIKYYHPDYLSTRPIDWHDTLKVPINYQSGLPTLEDICKLEKHTCLVIDDLYEECINSRAIDYLFRVLSGKNTISVMIMSQRYFAQGRFGMNIRNNCNFTALLRNADARVNSKIACLMNLKTAIGKAVEDTYANNYYPYIFVDLSPRGQVSGYQVYTNIFDPYQIVYSTSGMKAYIIAEKDFIQYFRITNSATAEPINGKYEKKTICNRSQETEDSSPEFESDTCNKFRQRAKKIRDRRKNRQNIQRYQKHT